MLYLGMKIKLGMQYRDVVTGFVGTAVSCTKYLYGESRIGLQPFVDGNNTLPDVILLHPDRLELAEERKIAIDPN